MTIEFYDRSYCILLSFFEILASFMIPISGRPAEVLG